MAEYVDTNPNTEWWGIYNTVENQYTLPFWFLSYDAGRKFVDQCFGIQRNRIIKAHHIPDDANLRDVKALRDLADFKTHIQVIGGKYRIMADAINKHDHHLVFDPKTDPEISSYLDAVADCDITIKNRELD